MTFPGLLVLSVGLAMDATAAAAVRGAAARVVRLRDVVAVAGLFGGFQALMPLLGWLVGRSVGNAIAAWDHWIAFALLAGIGAHMLWEARKPAEDADTGFALRVLVVLALATSIDALAVGIMLPLLDAPLVLSLVTIGVTTAVLSAFGLFAGRRFGAMLGQRLDAVGGLVLIGFGTKILLQHLLS